MVKSATPSPSVSPATKVLPASCQLRNCPALPVNASAPIQLNDWSPLRSLRASISASAITSPCPALKSVMVSPSACLALLKMN